MAILIFMRYAGFSKRFREACLRAGAPDTQVALGKFLGVSGTMAWNYRNGEKLPATDTGISIAIKLNVSFDWLMTGRGPMEVLDPDQLEKLKEVGALSKEGIKVAEIFDGIQSGEKRTQAKENIVAIASTEHVKKKTG